MFFIYKVDYPLKFKEEEFPQDLVQTKCSKKDIDDFSFDIDVYNGLKTIGEKMRYITLYDQIPKTSLIELQKVFIDQFKDGIQNDPYCSLEALIKLLKYECFQEKDYHDICNNFLIHCIPTDAYILKSISKLILYFNFDVSYEFLISLINKLVELSYEEKKMFIEMIQSFIISNHDIQFLQNYFDSIKDFLLESIESMNHEIISISSLLFEKIIIPEDFLIELFDKIDIDE
ncbi:hypothetical protein M9Y10_008045 [Tritrichomonas musculus]|uniref:Uncharacterized protein n=1 Tax=Tritrichomonas musculus TaxID=1915356 RepID=A0ABR2IXB8_9EUKA